MFEVRSQRKTFILSVAGTRKAFILISVNAYNLPMNQDSVFTDIKKITYVNSVTNFSSAAANNFCFKIGRLVFFEYCVNTV